MRIAAQRTDLEAGFLDRVEGVRTERFVDGNFSHSTLFAVCAPFALEKIGYYYIMIILSEIRPRRCYLKCYLVHGSCRQPKCKVYNIWMRLDRWPAII